MHTKWTLNVNILYIFPKNNVVKLGNKENIVKLGDFMTSY